MFSRRNLLSSLATLVPSYFLLSPKTVENKQKFFHKKNEITILGDGHYSVKDKSGTRRYYFCGMLHRVDGPSVIDLDGTHEWYKMGEYHREDGPAITGPYGESWIQNGLYHREDGPAVTRPDGSYGWYKNGEPHRIGGPALNAVHIGQQTWCENGITIKMKLRDGSFQYYNKDKNQFELHGA